MVPGTAQLYRSGVFVIGKYMSVSRKIFTSNWVNSTGHSAQKRRDSVAKVLYIQSSFFSLTGPGVAVQSDDSS